MDIDNRVGRELGSEVETLMMFLDYLRNSIISKLGGIGDAEARTPQVLSGTNLGGLIQHLTMAEAKWFGEVFAGSDLPLPTSSMEVDPNISTSTLIKNYRDAIELSDVYLHAADGDATTSAKGTAWGDPVNLRWVLLHMIEETARHAGHADILREQLDGRVGR